MSNPGAYPLDPNTNVGKFRLLVGDVNSVVLAPPVSGQQDYTTYSDAEIEVYLSLGGDSIFRAAGLSQMQAADAAAEQSKSVADYDLKADLTKRATDHRDNAKMWFQLADAQDATSGDGSYFDIVDTGTDVGLYDGIEAFPYWPGFRG